MLIITGKKSKVWSLVYFNVAIWLTHGNLLKRFTNLCAYHEVFLEMKVLKDRSARQMLFASLQVQ